MNMEDLLKSIWTAEETQMEKVCTSSPGVRFLSLFRFKLWWMTQRMGTCGKDIPLETQFMPMESKDTTKGEYEDAPTIYIVFLPLLEGQFCAVLQADEKNELEIYLESGQILLKSSTRL